MHSRRRYSVKVSCGKVEASEKFIFIMYFIYQTYPLIRMWASQARKEKSAFIRLRQSKINCIICKPCLAVWRSGWELKTRLGPSVSRGLIIFFLTQPHTSLWIWGENYKYRVLRKDSSVLSVAVAWFYDGTVVLTSSTSSSSSSHFFNIWSSEYL